MKVPLFVFITGIFVVGVPPIKVDAEPVIAVSPYDHQHVYESGATGFTNFGGHLKRATNKDEILRWLFVDLNIDYIRTHFNATEALPGPDAANPAGNDNSAPNSINWSSPNWHFPTSESNNEWVYLQAKPLNPRLKTMTYGAGFPKWLRNADGTPNYSYPNFYAEVAEWMFANIVNLKQNVGIDCDILDICNEPDLSFGRDNTVNLIQYVVPLLRAWVNDPVHNPYGVKMPKIMAPSCIDTRWSRIWLTDWAANKPDVWNNIDIVSTHQYRNRLSADNFSAVNAIRGIRPFMQSETLTSHIDDSRTDERNGLDSAVDLGSNFSVAVNNGVSVYDYYMGNGPMLDARSLIKTPWGKAGERRKLYFAFKQLSSMQTRGSNVVPTAISGGVPSYSVVGYHHSGERKTWVTVTNTDITNQPIILRALSPRGSVLPISSVNVYETGGDANLDDNVDNGNNAALVSSESFSTALPEYRVQLPGKCLRTFEISWPSLTGFAETESLTVANKSSGDTHRVLSDANLSSGSGTMFEANATADYVTYIMPNVAAGNYSVRVGLRKDPNAGVFQLSVAASGSGSFSNIGSLQDDYSSAQSYSEVDLGTWSATTTGDKQFKFTVIGRNTSSAGYRIGVDYILLVPKSNGPIHNGIYRLTPKVATWKAADVAGQTR